MIPTPRTEAVMVDPLSDGNDLPQLARQLEIELSEVLRERDEAREALRVVLRLANDIPDESLDDWKNKFHKVLEETK